MMRAAAARRRIMRQALVHRLLGQHGQRCVSGRSGTANGQALQSRPQSRRRVGMLSRRPALSSARHVV